MAKKRVYKVVLLGEGAVGKTALRDRYLGKGFKHQYQMTIGAEFAIKDLSVGNTDVSAQIWDLAGQIRFNKVREMYYRGSVGALIVFDITRPETFYAISSWMNELMQNNDHNKIPMLVIGNKSDLRGESQDLVTEEQATSYVDEISDLMGQEVSYIETSALNGENVNHAFATLIDRVHRFVIRMRDAQG